MEILRTPDSQFQKLPDYPFEPHYTEIDSGDGGNLRVHHIDEGDRAAPIVLCLHGQPSWSYLYRKELPLSQDGAAIECVEIAGDRPGSSGIREIKQARGARGLQLPATG